MKGYFVVEFEEMDIRPAQELQTRVAELMADLGIHGRVSCRDSQPHKTSEGERVEWWKKTVQPSTHWTVALNNG